MTNAYDLPTPEEELERKSMDELSRIIHLYESGRVTHREMNLMLDTLWGCVSGLAGEDWTRFMEEARRIPRTDGDWTFIGLLPEKGHWIIARREEEAFSVTIRRGAQVIKRIDRDYSTQERASEDARDAWNKTINSLIEKGVSEL